MSLPPNAPSTRATSALAAIEEAKPLCKQWFEAYGTAVYNYFRFHLPLPDVAEILGVGAGTVRTRLWRALDRLRNALEL